MWEKIKMQDNSVRINKFLSEAGVCSRREADRQIEAGNVLIDGIKATCGDRVLPGQLVTYNGRVVSKEEEMILSVCRNTEEEELMRSCTYAYQYPANLVLKSFREEKKDRK